MLPSRSEFSVMCTLVCENALIVHLITCTCDFPDDIVHIIGNKKRSFGKRCNTYWSAMHFTQGWIFEKPVKKSSDSSEGLPCLKRTETTLFPETTERFQEPC